MLNLHWKKAAFGILAASLVLSPAALAKENGNGNNDQVESAVAVDQEKKEKSVSENAKDTYATESVTDDVYESKENKIQDKYSSLNGTEKVYPSQAVEGKLHALANRLNALKTLSQEAQTLLNEIQAEIDKLSAEEQDTAVDIVVENLVNEGNLEEAAELQSNYVKKLADEPEEKLLEEYRVLGKIHIQLGKTGVKAFVNAEQPEMDVAPFTENGRTLVPFRALVEALGGEVAYDPQTKTVTVTKDGKKVVLTINGKTAFINGKAAALDVPAQTKNGRTVVPLRFLGEALDAKVLWEKESKSAIVINNGAKAKTGADR